MPASAIDKHSGVDVIGKLGGNFIEMHLHHFGVYGGQYQPDGGVSFRAERTEDIGVFVARVDGAAYADSLPSPATRPRAFLPYSAFVLTPEFDGFPRVFRLDFREDSG